MRAHQRSLIEHLRLMLPRWSKTTKIESKESDQIEWALLRVVCDLLKSSEIWSLGCLMENRFILQTVFQFV